LTRNRAIRQLSQQAPPRSTRMRKVAQVTAENARVRIRPEIAATTPYRQGKQAPDDAFKLSSNENPYPTHPAVLEAISRSTHSRYPDAAATELRTALAARLGVELDAVHIGAGSVALLAQLIQAVAGP